MRPHVPNELPSETNQAQQPDEQQPKTDTVEFEVLYESSDSDSGDRQTSEPGDASSPLSNVHDKEKPTGNLLNLLTFCCIALVQ